jgi:hypothetical protein
MICNENYFEKIDTEDKAYWLGFLYADGCVTQNHDSVILCLSANDLDHLKMFRRCIETDYKIGYGNNDKYVRLAIYKKKLAEDLVHKGCIPAKSLILKFPTEEQIPKELIRHFIRGYFDGDGCIYSKFKKNRNCVYLDTEVNFLGTQEFLQCMLKYLPVDGKITERGKDNIFALRIYNKNTILQLMDFMYKDSNFYLHRKYVKFIDLKEYMTNKSKVA